MNTLTNLLKEYVDFVDTTKRQYKYSKIAVFPIVFFIALFLFFVIFKYRNKKNSFSRSNTKKR